MLNIVLIDGYVDEPSAFGVPPYISFHLRYIYGAIKKLGLNATYLTIDQYRRKIKIPKLFKDIDRPDLLILVAGCIVPGKYLRGIPLTINEAKQIVQSLEPKTSIFGGAVARFGFGGIGGEEIVLSKKIKPLFDFVAKLDIDATVYDYLRNDNFVSRKRSLEEWKQWSILGSELIKQHPDFPLPLIIEIETMQGCPRYINGGCNFCIEPLLKLVSTRAPLDIIKEIGSLYQFGARNFRLGGQTDVYSYMATQIGEIENPRPNISAWKQLLVGIHNVAPKLEVLHLDNANPSVIAQYPDESREITKLFVKFCTPGNILPFGLESADPMVIKANNLNTTPEETLFAIEQINELGSTIGYNGLPKLLPGLNFVFGLLKETKLTFKLNYDFLNLILEKKLLVRRINLRQVASLSNIEFNTEKYKTNFHIFKRKIREQIDKPLLKQIVPIGRILKAVYMEKHDKIFTHGRQIGSYPILMSIPFLVPLDRFNDVMVVGHGFRSISVLPIPIQINLLEKKNLSLLPGFGKKRGNKIHLNKPYNNFEELKNIIDDKTIFDKYKIKENLAFDKE